MPAKTTTIVLEDDEEIRDMRRALTRLRDDTNSPARKARITKMLDKIEAVESVRQENEPA